MFQGLGLGSDLQCRASGFEWLGHAHVACVHAAVALRLMILLMQ